MPNKVVYLYQIYGDNTIILDTAYVTENKKAAFILNDSLPTGLYRCLFGDNLYLDVIFNHGHIDFITEYNHPVDSMQVLVSKENKLLYDFFKFNRLYELKSEYLIPIIRFYPEKDDLYFLAEKKYNELQYQRDSIIVQANKKYPDSFLAKYLNTFRTPIIDTKMPDDEKIKYLKEHFFDYIDFNDTALFYSNGLTNKIIDFLKFYRNENISRHDEELQFIEAVDLLFSKISIDDACYNFILEYLIKGFEHFKYDEVLEHIAANYTVKSVCSNEERKSELQKALDYYKKTAIGSTVPDIKLKDINGKEISMFDAVKTDFTMLIFWQTTCPHCIELFPKLKDYYNSLEKRNFEIFAVSIDTNTEAWKKFIKEGGYNWINVNESNGWENKVLDDYNIFATPTILILDKKHKIIAKPVDMKEIRMELKKIQ
ncbi:MAG: hypothetical protein Kow0068_25980 [Marinilabiliales bacterium]